MVARHRGQATESGFGQAEPWNPPRNISTGVWSGTSGPTKMLTLSKISSPFSSASPPGWAGPCPSGGSPNGMGGRGPAPPSRVARAANGGLGPLPWRGFRLRLAIERDGARRPRREATKALNAIAPFGHPSGGLEPLPECLNRVRIAKY
jgi:hypothetical protein